MNAIRHKEARESECGIKGRIFAGFGTISFAADKISSCAAVLVCTFFGKCVNKIVGFCMSKAGSATVPFPGTITLGDRFPALKEISE